MRAYCLQISRLQNKALQQHTRLCMMFAEVMGDYHWQAIAWWRCISDAFSLGAPDAQLFRKVNVHLVPQGDQWPLKQLVPAGVAGAYRDAVARSQEPLPCTGWPQALCCKAPA